MSKLKELREKRAELVPRIKELREQYNAEDREWTSENEQNWEKLNQDYDTLMEEIREEEKTTQFDTRLEEIDEYDRRFQARQDEKRKAALLSGDGGADPEDRDDDRRPSAGEAFRGAEEISEETRALALQAWALRGRGPQITEKHVLACRQIGINPAYEEIDLRILSSRGAQQMAYEYRLKSYAEKRAMSTSATAGGETIPQGFVRNWELALLAIGGVRPVADIIRTAAGEDLPWPTTDDTSNSGELIAENAQHNTQDVATGNVIFKAYMYSSKIVLVSRQLIQDSAFDLAATLGTLLGIRIARATNAHFTTGTGTAQPKGIVTAATVGVTAASPTAIAADELIDLVHSVDPDYRMPGMGAGFMLHDSIIKALRKLKDSQNRYLWQPMGNLASGQFDSLLGYPYQFNQNMASSIAASAKTILFGALSKYKIRDVAGMTLQRLVERYAEYAQIGFIGLSRHDGNLLDAGTAPVKVLQQAAS